jgi:aminoglycoside phosphotransferase (APT) family kinase protein
VAERTYGNLGELRDDQLQAAADRFGLGRVRVATALTDGLFGKNVRLDTDTGTWVLRGDPWPAGVDHQYRRERCFALAIHERSSVPAPWPYHVESTAGILPWPFAVMPYLDGRDHFAAEAKTPAARIEVARGLGRAAAALGQVTWPACGEWLPDGDGVVAFAGTPAEWLCARTNAMVLRTARTSEPLDLRSQGVVDEHLAGAAASLERAGADFQPALVHHDFKTGNTAMRRNADGTYDVTGVFDLQECYVGDPIEDLARPLCDVNRYGPEVGAAFLLAYGAPIPVERLRAYVVFDRLVLWEYGRRPGVDWYDAAATFAGWAGETLLRVDDAIDQHARAT